MKFVISTQCLENYGAHLEDGKFTSGNAYWKMKGGSDYIVEGLTRIQDAVAYGYKEFPTQFRTFEDWKEELQELDEEHARETLYDAINVSLY